MGKDDSWAKECIRNLIIGIVIGLVFGVVMLVCCM